MSHIVADFALKTSFIFFLALYLDMLCLQWVAMRLQWCLSVSNVLLCSFNFVAIVFYCVIPF